MNDKRFLTAVSVDAFQQLLDELEHTVGGVEDVPLEAGIHRVLAESVTSGIDVPQFSKSKVDGYALRAVDTFKASEGRPVMLECAGTVRMGSVPDESVSEGACMYVPTGGMVPGGADAVVKVEFTETEKLDDGTERVVIQAPLVPGQAIIAQGADMKKGAVVLEAGCFLTIPRIGCAAAAGVKRLKVFPRMRVGLFSSGDEIVDPAGGLPPGKIYDVNSITLKSFLEQAGCTCTLYGIVPDELDPLLEVFRKAISENDVVVCSGGTSKGRGDLMPQIIERDPTTRLEVHGVRVKPGKPIIFALLQDKPVFVLPGNPTSAIVGFIKFIEPFIRKAAHLPPKVHQVVKATLAGRVYSELGRREIKPVALVPLSGGRVDAKPIAKGSETITTLLDADGYFEIPENQEIAEQGDEVTVVLF